MEAAADPDVRPAIDAMGRLVKPVSQEMFHVHKIRDAVLGMCDYMKNSTQDPVTHDDVIAGLAMAFATFSLDGKCEVNDSLVLKMTLCRENEADYVVEVKAEVVP